MWDRWFPCNPKTLACLVRAALQHNVTVSLRDTPRISNDAGTHFLCARARQRQMRQRPHSTAPITRGAASHSAISAPPPLRMNNPVHNHFPVCMPRPRAQMSGYPQSEANHRPLCLFIFSVSCNPRPFGLTALQGALCTRHSHSQPKTGSASTALL